MTRRPNPHRLAAALSVLIAAGVALAMPAWAGPVPVLTVGEQAVAQGLTLDASIEPVQQVTVSAQASGLITRWQVQAGDAVQAGQLLALIDDRETQAGVARTQAAAQGAQAALQQATLERQRTRDLHAQGFLSRAALDAAEARYQGTLAARQEAGAANSQIAVAQGNTRVLAPFAGRVLQTHAESGDLALPGKPLLTLYAPQPLRAVVQVPASRQAEALAASAVVVRLPDGSWSSPQSKQVLSSTDPVAQTVEWRLDLTPSDAARLSPGWQTQVRWTTTQQARLMLPSSAIVRRAELSAVYVVQDSRFVLRAVRLGADHGAAGIEVLAGLKPGVRVARDAVAAGLQDAVPGTAP